MIICGWHLGYNGELKSVAFSDKLLFSVAQITWPGLFTKSTASRLIFDSTATRPEQIFSFANIDKYSPQEEIFSGRVAVKPNLCQANSLKDSGE